MSYIYFIQAGDNGNIKIGFSRSVNSRLCKMQTDMPEKLRLLLVIEGDVAGERRLHHELKDFRVHGEWFVPHSTVLKTIENLQVNSVAVSGARKRIPKTTLDATIRELGYTSTSLATALGTAQGHMSNILTGKRPCSVKMAKRLEKLTGRSWHSWLDDSYQSVSEAA